jgi:hypothetical protein
MDLHLQIDGDEIVVTRPGTDFELVYGRPRGERNLRLKRSWISRTDATPAVNEFRRAAQQAATAKARELGWNRFAVVLMSTLELSLTNAREDVSMEAELPRFHVFDGSTRLVIEAHDQEDALCLCVEMGWEFVCCCEG